ncbi:hypothetical protein GF323_06135 [Candidatus Woesearchaeota archaeon]|nr:hypothetical protein [Candidatus Woesearchaeota archaeon]
MVSQKVLKYVQSKFSQNVPESQIIANLKKVGLSSKIIQKAIQKTKRNISKKSGDKQGNRKSSKEKMIFFQRKKPETKADPRVEMLKRYIKNALAKNIPKEKIMEDLIKAGWKKEQLQRVLLETGKAKEEEDKKERPKKLSFDVGKTEKEIKSDKNIRVLEEYSFKYMDMAVKVICYSQRGQPVTFYNLIIPIISGTTDLILEEIRQKLIEQINLGTLEIAEGNFNKLDKHVQERLVKLVEESFPHVDTNVQRFLISYLISKVLGLGIIEIIKADESLEEVVINNSTQPVYVYHKKWGWCKTNKQMPNDDQIIHLASMTGRKVGREITNLTPLLDAHLPTGDRVNATIKPITVDGPTITIRKFSTDPWTITKFLKTKTMDYTTAALVWLAIRYELSALIVGGTASGKTSCLNVLTNLIPPNQRIVSIEDTREIRLPNYMHWVPMVSRAPNPEGKGGIEMEDLLVNSLRMRPDRIIVGEVRKKLQAETLFEAIHTGHSCYATFHANNAEEAIVRLTNPPVSLSKTLLPAISLMVVQYRNRRTGLRRTFQIAEIDRKGDSNVLYQYNPKTDSMNAVNQSRTLFKTLEMFTGNTFEELNQMLKEKIKVLQYMVKNNYSTIEQVGRVIALYYTEHDYLMNIISQNKPLW